MNRLILSTLVVSVSMLVGCASSRQASPPMPPAYGTLGAAQLFDNIGAHTRRVTTSSPEAQRYFDQGLNWLYAFNHDEAVLSFAKAGEIDPGCAMAWWGVAVAQGPNYNDPFVTDSRYAAAKRALARARAALDDETALERALIEAQGIRFVEPPSALGMTTHGPYSEAMRALYERHPQDADVGTLYAEALMVQHPWMLYTLDGEPARQQTLDAVAALERVLANDPYHPGANHLYIHAIEPSNDKARAIPAADRLRDMVPDSGHMLHMPSHIYVQVGMWEEAIEQNAKSMVSDDIYRERAPEQVIQHGYMLHNAHMRAFAAMMIGRESDALLAARDMVRDFPKDIDPRYLLWFDGPMSVVYDVHKRFGRWEALLAEPAPRDDLPVTNAIWHAHRAIAHAALEDFENAEMEQRSFRDAIKRIPQDWTYAFNIKRLLVSDFFIGGEIQLQMGNYDAAAMMLEEAVAIEDTIGYGEPPQWLQPARHTLGVVYMKGERFAEAERVYREDLERWPGNGWGLLGLSQALEAQGKDEEASVVRAAFDRVWERADEPLTSSCKCVSDL